MESISSETVRDLLYIPKPPPISWLQAGVLTAVGKWTVSQQAKDAESLYLVHQIGKVGSTSMTNAITRAGLVGFHTHQLNPQERGAAFRSRLWKSWAPRRMWGTSPWIRRLIQKRVADSVLITGIRNPIEREISGIMQNPDRYLTTHRRLRTDDEIRSHLPDIVQAVNHNLSINRLDSWFVAELDYLLQEPFPWEAKSELIKDTGHAHFRGANGLSVHVVRFENLSEGFTKIAEIEDRPELELPHDNSSNSSRVVEMVREHGLRRASIDAALAQRTVRACYPEDQIETWAAEWY
jgi:hypothetical protein